MLGKSEIFVLHIGGSNSLNFLTCFVDLKRLEARMKNKSTFLQATGLGLQLLEPGYYFTLGEYFHSISRDADTAPLCSLWRLVLPTALPPVSKGIYNSFLCSYIHALTLDTQTLDTHRQTHTYTLTHTNIHIHTPPNILVINGPY